MNCFYHPEKEGVGVCKTCGRAICADCAVELRPSIFSNRKSLVCRELCSEKVKSTEKIWSRTIGVFVVFFSILGLLSFYFTGSSPLFYGAVIAAFGLSMCLIKGKAR